jgi:hypothetical protein
VSATASERTGVIVVRVWVENGDDLRARITSSLDVSSDEQTVTAAGGVEEAVQLVRDWLERFLVGGSSGEAG